MSIWWSLHLRREAASVPLARRLLLGTMETAGVDPDVSFDLSVALSEACANAVEHGGGTAHGGSSEAYRVTAYLDGEKCRIEVADSGPGFPPDPGLPPAPDLGPGRFTRTPLRPVPARSDAEHGRGLCLIQELADHVQIGNKPGRGGAVVSFDKILKWKKDAPLMAV
ncbi:ATP-binding protein [Streptomyces sp. NBC_00038]|uniref:ATP-binding protein n=1 Tax=Streptomyces sp. NBC_00038 TaxID=2903615 RepID=UPI00225A57E5|nr:ATP-binding protein [Streptomyces sp. NBC_00038]MCX5558952.1 ATP-binding protein [Streptomyces sp. NBC_00038]